jgi:hypothetical protein
MHEDRFFVGTEQINNLEDLIEHILPIGCFASKRGKNQFDEITIARTFRIRKAPFYFCVRDDILSVCINPNFGSNERLWPLDGGELQLQGEQESGFEPITRAAVG